MGQRSVHLESASDIDECCLTMCNHPNEIFDETVEKYGDVWIVGESQCLRDTAAHDDVVTGDEDRARLSTKAAVSCHTIVARVLYVIKRSIMDRSLDVEFLTVRVRTPNTNKWEKMSHPMEYVRVG
jgi:hypothetical protein